MKRFLQAVGILVFVALGVLAYPRQRSIGHCNTELLKLGHAEAIAIQTWRDSRDVPQNSTTPAHEMFQAADDYLRMEKQLKAGDE